MLGKQRWNIWPRRRRIPLRCHDGAARWVTAPRRRDDIVCPVLTVSTFNIWFDAYFADERYRALADLLAAHPADVMVFQEVTDRALDVLLAQPWIRRDYAAAAVTGRRVGNYGMLLLSRIPLSQVTYTRLPTAAHRGFLTAVLISGGTETVLCSVHLDSGKRNSALRARQFREIDAEFAHADDVVLLGDFNMRDDENSRITAPWCDVWPALRAPEPGFTEDTSINHMRCDATGKERFVRFDRVLVKGEQWRPDSVELIGTEPISPAHPRVFPSDHFGLRCVLVRNTG
ncbi:endonuclease/exonuclease/phosphatase family protein [Mycolicibacterium gilvum]|uniref:endonuclease/exonuclease/phosphatase family protein n=1 Tax=Mycolicibacterium gilvum TaxID=1804 RepID=UPI00030E6C40|nr:endonuclease/exonuclease/phosphatase family protein [Mycolicibacterium gilvum]